MKIIFLALLLLSGCAHRWYYTPEIKGVGEMHGGNGDIIYRVPPKGHPSLSMAVRGLGIKKKGDMALLGMRMSFSQPKNAAHVAGTLDAREQVLYLGDTAIEATYVRSEKRKETVVDLSPEHVVIELLYPLPKGSDGADGIEKFRFRWKIHYGANQAEQQLAQFNRNDAAPQQSGSLFPDDPFYPYDRTWLMEPSWAMNDPLWWTMGPW
jgi:hypothetical protein